MHLLTHLFYSLQIFIHLSLVIPSLPPNVFFHADSFISNAALASLFHHLKSGFLLSTPSEAQISLPIILYLLHWFLHSLDISGFIPFSCPMLKCYSISLLALFLCQPLTPDCFSLILLPSSFSLHRYQRNLTQNYRSSHLFHIENKFYHISTNISLSYF